MKTQFFPGMRVQTLMGEIDTDHSGAERSTPALTWGHICGHNHSDHWDVCFPNGAWVVLTEAELADSSSYQTAVPETLEQIALALKYGQESLQLTYLDAPLDSITQSLAGNPGLILEHVKAFEQMRSDAKVMLATIRDAWNRWDKEDQDSNPSLGDSLARFASTSYEWDRHPS